MKILAGLGVGLVVCSNYLVTVDAFEELREPPVLRSEDGELTVKLKVNTGLVEGPFGVSYMSRLYNGGFPGPTLRVRAGDKVNILLENELGDNDEELDAKAPMNTLRHPNSTNLHVHGMHISGEQDNVVANVEPGTLHKYTYNVPDDHQAGVIYYHPHLHGSAGLHISSQMGGALIVEDEAGSMSPELAAMDERLMILQSIYTSAGASTFAHNGTSTMDADFQNPNNITKNLLLVNSQYEPHLPMKTKEFKRFRLVNALVGDAVHFGIDNDKACKMYEIAWDGVYLPEPKRVRSVFLPSGGRMDIIVKCNKAGNFRLKTLTSEKLDGLRNYWSAISNEFTEENTQTLVHLNVRKGTNKNMRVPKVLPALPSYLQELVNQSEQNPDLPTSFNLSFSNEQGQMVVNGAFFDPTKPLTSQKLNNLYQWKVEALEPNDGGTSAQHPYHQHVNHYLTMETDTYTDGLLYRKGVIRDTIPLYLAAGPAHIRTYPADFRTTVMIHCHNVNHEDRGMMATALIE